MNQELLKQIGAGALAGLISAAAVDYSAFKRWKSFDEAVKYKWSLALWRWFKGAVIGAVTSAGVGAV